MVKKKIKKIKKKILKNKNIIFLVFFIFILFTFIIFLNNNKDEVKKEVKKIEEKIKVEALPKDNILKLSGFVKSENIIELMPEQSGKVLSVKVKKGDKVKKNQLLAVIENINQRIAVKNAQIDLQSALTELKKLENNNNLNDKNSTLSQTVSVIDSKIKAAKNTYLNSDLKAYPDDFEEKTDSPIISGNYNCEKEGEYILDVYSSSTESGGSFRFSGLESGVASVSVKHPIKLGKCGLEVKFPVNFSKDEKWVVYVPNTRSPLFSVAKKQYETLLESKKLQIKKTTVLPEEIQRQKNIIQQKKLVLESARISLSKTYIKSPTDGVIEDVYIKKGSVASLSSSFATLISKNLEFYSDVSITKASLLSVGKSAELKIGNKKYKVKISSIVNSSKNNSQKQSIIFNFEKEPKELKNGQIGEVYIDFEFPYIKVPRYFIGFGYKGPFVNCLGKEKLVEIEDENVNNYWIEFKGDSCDGYLYLPHNLDIKYE